MERGRDGRDVPARVAVRVAGEVSGGVEGDARADDVVQRVEDQAGDRAEDARTGHAGGGELGHGRALHHEEAHHQARNSDRELAKRGGLLGRKVAARLARREQQKNGVRVLERHGVANEHIANAVRRAGDHGVTA